MFYCEDCARKNGWPTDFWIPRSHGGCEVCGKGGTCFDVPSTQLPPARPIDPERFEDLYNRMQAERDNNEEIFDRYS